MTDLFAPAVAAPTDEPERRIPRGLFRFAGAALIAFPVLFTGGMIFSPPQTEAGDAGYIAALAAEPFVSHVSANLLHYSWVALALGVMGLIGLVGRRGRAWVAIASVVVAFGAVQMSGLLLSDWFLIAAGNTLSMDQALALDGNAKELTVLVWLLSAQVFTILGIPVLTMGLARARVVSWWIAPLPLIAFVIPMLNLGLIAAIAFTPLMAPVIIAGVKLIRRG